MNASRIHGVVRIAIAVWCATLALANRVSAQGAVAGTVAIVERGSKSSKDLAEAVVYLMADRVTARAGSAIDNAVVNMTGREFVPHVQIVRAGGSVAYPNKDPFSHNVFSNTALGAFDLGLYRSGASRAAVFARPGVYAIYCNIHARMVNFVLAVNTPYVARVNKHGAFQLSGVPAGTYRLHVWHERAAESVQTVSVLPNGLVGLKVTLDARSYAPVPHPDKFGKPYASTRADRY
ncbi:MAG: methylamine utilization protein [Gemmatimonas sp.]